jgi:hypothetical protein
MVSISKEEKFELIFPHRFVTEQDIIPASGLMNPNMFCPHRDKITIECMTLISLPPTALPVAHVCFYKLDLPDYDDYETLETKLLLAICNTSTFELQ